MANGAATDGSDVVEVRFYLPKNAVDEVTRLAERHSVQEPELIRRSISLMSFVQKLTDKGGDLLVEWPDGSTERVVLPPWWQAGAYR